MGEKVTFDEINKIIHVTLAPDANGDIYIDVKEDLYSDGKEDWIANENLRKFYFPISAVGGNPLPGEKALGTTFFLASDWKIKPYDASHRLTINGNLYAEDGSDLFLDPDGAYTVRIMQQVSSLVDSTIQQLEEIEYASFDGGITIDINSGYSILNPPPSGLILGTPRAPVDNLDDAISIASNRGLNDLYFISDYTFDSSVYISNYNMYGTGMQGVTFTFQYGSICAYCSVNNSRITGSVLGINNIQNCFIYNYGGETPVASNADIIMKDCLFGGNLIIPSNFTGSIQAIDCNTVETNLENVPILNMSNADCVILARNLSGSLNIFNVNDDTTDISLDIKPGNITLDTATVTRGHFTIRGLGILQDELGNEIHTGTWNTNVVINTTELLNQNVITKKVWDEPLSEHTEAGTIGGSYYAMVQTFPRLLGLMQENFKLDNQIYQDYNGINLLTSGRIRTYNDSALTDLLATYEITAEWTDGKCTGYQVVKL